MTRSPVDLPHLPILVIDDDDELADVICLFLNEEGYRNVRWFSCGEEAVAAARRTPPALIMLDWQMPKVSGGQVLAMLKAEPRLANIPVLLMSAHLEDIPADHLAAYGSLRKPFDAELMTRSIANQLAG